MHNMELTEDEKKEWEQWLSEIPEKVREVAERVVPWKMYKDTRMPDVGDRYCPVSYDEHEDGTVTLTCAKVNEEFPFFGGYNVFGMNPNDLVEDKKL